MKLHSRGNGLEFDLILPFEMSQDQFTQVAKEFYQRLHDYARYPPEIDFDHVDSGRYFFSLENDGSAYELMAMAAFSSTLTDRFYHDDNGEYEALKAVLQINALNWLLAEDLAEWDSLERENFRKRLFEFPEVFYIAGYKGRNREIETFLHSLFKHIVQRAPSNSEADELKAVIIEQFMVS